MKVRRAGDAEPTRPRAIPRRQRAIDKAMGRYVLLECGHYTTREAALVFECFRPYKSAIFCETCEDWSVPVPKAPSVPLPDIPLF